MRDPESQKSFGLFRLFLTDGPAIRASDGSRCDLFLLPYPNDRKLANLAKPSVLEVLEEEASLVPFHPETRFLSHSNHACREGWLDFLGWQPPVSPGHPLALASSSCKRWTTD